MKRLTILLVEDDPEICREIEQYTADLEDTVLVDVVNDSTRAEHILREKLPDALILDLELHRGGGSGLTLLQALRRQPPAKLPYILVTTNNSSQLTYEAVRQLGADYIIYKHQEGYRSKDAVDFLRSLRDIIHNTPAPSPQPSVRAETPDQEEKRILRRIIEEFSNVGISPKATGYQYLMDAVLIVIKSPKRNLSTIIGEKYGKTESSVERAMQNAIIKAWRITPIEDLLRHYTARISSDKGIPTITEFIYFYANKLRNEN